MKIIYLHGFGSSPQSKKAGYFRERFASLGVEMLVPELGADFENLTITSQLAKVREVAAGEPCALIGSSLGGYVAALYAARYDHVRKAVLMAPAFQFARRWRESLGPAVYDAWEQTGVRQVFHYGEMRDLPLRFTLVTDARAYEDFPAVTQPCVVFHGIHDDTVPVSYSRQFAASRSNVELHEEESDHELINVLDRMWERTKAFLLP